MRAESTPASANSLPLTSLLTVGADLFSEVQRIIGSSRVRALRVKLGSRTLKEIPVAPLTAVTTILMVLAAVVISNMSIEVEHEPSVHSASEARP